ncbi:MAG: hypothetical protein K0R71_794 [Bacillales bacterium]|jgi:hypothetical protein|nr:hypothetical protein [Bacillales bacterium]
MDKISFIMIKSIDKDKNVPGIVFRERSNGESFSTNRTFTTFELQLGILHMQMK